MCINALALTIATVDLLHDIGFKPRHIHRAVRRA
jgi:hypothetical protein